MKTRSQTSLNRSVILSSPYFLCGCGLTFFNKEHFKNHSLRFHQGQYVDGSTHFLVKRSQVILPMQHIPQIAENKKNSRLACHKELPEEKATQVSEFTDKSTLSFKVETANQNHEKGQKKTQKDKIYKSTKFYNKDISTITSQSILTKQNKFQEEIIEWNGFRLTKNKKCEIEPYYCGLCSEKFSLPEDFIVHSIDVCQQLKNPHSSHFISCTALQQEQNFSQIQDDVLKAIEDDDEQCVSTTFDHEQEFLNPAEEVTLDPLKIITKMMYQSEDLTFYCGFCDKNIVNAKSTALHIFRFHKYIIHPLSSHIIIRVAPYLNSIIRNLYASISMFQHITEPIFYCPCAPYIKMMMEQLHKHVMEIHDGISPIYYKHYGKSGRFIKKQKGKKKSIKCCQQKIFEKYENDSSVKDQKQEKSERPQEIINPFLYLFLNAQKCQKYDHSKLMPLRCQQCDIELHKVPYRLHLLKKKQKHKNITAQSFSHVIITIKKHNMKNRFYYGYLSPKIEWRVSEPIYYCPCSPGNKLTMKELLQHHIKIHNFVSPVYSRDQP